MANNISPETLAALRARGWIPPGPAQQPANPMPPPSGTPAPAVPLNAQGGAVAPGAPPPPPSPPTLAQRLGPAATSPAPLIPPPKAQGDFVDPSAAGAGGGAQPKLELPKGHQTDGGFASTVSPGVRKELDEAGAGEALGALRTGEAESRANIRATAAIDAQAAAAQKLAQEQAIGERRRQDALTAQANDYKAMQEEAAKGQIDPDRWMGNHSKALATVAMALGAFGSGLSRGRNPNWAADMVNQRISADIDAQKENIANKRKNAEASSNLYAMKLRQFGDERQAELATHAQLIEQYKLTAQAEAQRAQSPVMMAKAKQLTAQLDMEQAKLHAQLEKYVPPSGGGNEAELVKRTMELRDKAAANGHELSPQEARQVAIAEMTGQDHDAPGYAKAPAGSKAEPPDSAVAGTTGKSTAWNPLRYIPGTDAANTQLENEQQNAPILGYVHKAFGARTPEAQEHIAAPFLRQPGDSQARLEAKHRGLVKMLAAAKGGQYSGDPNDYLEQED